MATSTGEVEKINVRSPFYLTIDSEGAPPAYTPPATLTQPLGCGEQINIGEDVGTRIYEVDMTNRSGTFTINYTIYKPVKITTQVTGDAAVDRGYLGGDDHAQELIDIGISSSELTGLSSGAFAQGGIAINRSTDTAATLTITVEAPLATDQYQLSMSCPAETADPASSFSLPATPPTNTDLLSGSATLAMSLDRVSTSTFPVSPSLKIYVNGSLVETILGSTLNIDSNSIVPSVVFSNISGLEWASGVQSFGQSPIIVDNSSFISGSNKIELEFNWDETIYNSSLTIPQLFFYSTGIFRNTTANEYQFAYYEYQNTFSFYGASSLLTTEVLLTGADFFSFQQGVRYSFIYNTTSRTVSNSTDTNRLTITQKSEATGGIKV